MVARRSGAGDSAGSVTCADVMGLYAAVSQMAALGAQMRRQGAASKYCPYTFGVVPTGSSLLGWY